MIIYQIVNIISYIKIFFAYQTLLSFFHNKKILPAYGIEGLSINSSGFFLIV